MQPLATAAKTAGVPFYIGEGNSVSCGGEMGVSDTFAATLWAVDYLLNMASINVRGMNFHGGGTGPYTAIAYKSVNDLIPEVRPLYYGLWAFSDICKNEARILEMTLDSPNNLIKAWAVQNNKGITTVVVIHKDINATQPAVVTITPGKKLTGDAQLSLLKSSTDVSAKLGLSYAGLTFDGSQDGKPVGTRKTIPITPNSSGDYNFSIDPTTIVVLELPL